jgi:hypothetical protein
MRETYTRVTAWVNPVGLTRPELQRLARERGIKPGQSKAALIEAILRHERKRDSYALLGGERR